MCGEPPVGMKGGGDGGLPGSRLGGGRRFAQEKNASGDGEERDKGAEDEGCGAAHGGDGAGDGLEGGPRFRGPAGVEIAEDVVEKAHGRIRRSPRRQPRGRRLSVSRTAARTWAGVTRPAPSP